MISSKELLSDAKKQGYSLELRTLREYVKMGLLPKPIARKRQKEKGQGGGMIAYYPDKALKFLLTIHKEKIKGRTLKDIIYILYHKEHRELLNLLIKLGMDQNAINELKNRMGSKEVITQIYNTLAKEGDITIEPKITEPATTIHLSNDISELINDINNKREKQLNENYNRKIERKEKKVYRLLKETYGLSSKEKEICLLKWLIQEHEEEMRIIYYIHFYNTNFFYKCIGDLTTKLEELLTSNNNTNTSFKGGFLSAYKTTHAGFSNELTYLGDRFDELYNMNKKMEKELQILEQGNLANEQ